MQKSVSGSGTLTPSVQQDVSFEVSGTVTAVPGRGRADGHGRADARDGRHPAAERRPAAGEGHAGRARRRSSPDATRHRADRGRAGTGRRRAVRGRHRADRDGRRDARSRRSPGCSPRSTLEVGDAVGRRSGQSPAADGHDDRAVHHRRHRRVGGRRHGLATRTSRSSRSATRPRSRSTARPTPVFGTISAIGLLSTSDSGVAAYPVTVAVTGDQEGLHDGVTADVELVYERRTDVLTVPEPGGHHRDGRHDDRAAGGRRRRDRRRSPSRRARRRATSPRSPTAWPRATRSCSRCSRRAPAATGRQNQDQQQGGQFPEGAFPGGPTAAPASVQQGGSDEWLS